ncbi:hypothetical protein, partial [Amycolatopsis cihanbeyliensis]
AAQDAAAARNAAAQAQRDAAAAQAAAKSAQQHDKEAAEAAKAARQSAVDAQRAAEAAEARAREAAERAEAERRAAGQPGSNLRHLYNKQFLVTTDQDLPLHVTAEEVLRELKRCFNCSFPIDGAPADFPVDGQHIPLDACLPILGFICMDAPVKAYTLKENGQWAGFRFIAQEGHFDGAGSVIDFRFYTNSKSMLVMEVDARVSDPSAPDFINEQVALTKWDSFREALGQNIHEHGFGPNSAGARYARAMCTPQQEGRCSR